MIYFACASLMQNKSKSVLKHIGERLLKQKRLSRSVHFLQNARLGEANCMFTAVVKSVDVFKERR